MNLLSSVGGATSPPPARLSLQTLDMQILRRRARLAELEAEMIAACEAAALGNRPRTCADFERTHWERTVWHRYLAAAMRLEPDCGPRLRRLSQEIGQLDRLKMLPIAA
jgi:hypothetical protein